MAILFHHSRIISHCDDAIIAFIVIDFIEFHLLRHDQHFLDFGNSPLLPGFRNISALPQRPNTPLSFARASVLPCIIDGIIAFAKVTIHIVITSASFHSYSKYYHALSLRKYLPLRTHKVLHLAALLGVPQLSFNNFSSIR
jgi:hypothetical protein